MSNSIKYNSTGSENNALNKGNWWIGTGDVSKHPTSSTGFYYFKPLSMDISKNYGYIVYSPKPNGPSIHILNTDNKLIEFTNKTYNKNFSTIGECLEYYFNEPDLLCQNGKIESIITDGLVLYLDAGSVASYPKIGSVWGDLSGNGNDGNLVNNPTYLNDNDGVLEFDGVDDYIMLSSAINLSTFTIEFWMKKFTSDDNMPLGTYNTSTDFFRTGYQDGFEISIGNDSNRIGWSNTLSSNNIVGNFSHITVIKSGTDLELFINGVSQGTRTASADYSFTFETIGSGWNGLNYAYEGLLNNIIVYNKTLTKQEIEYNYNATKDKYINKDSLVLYLDPKKSNSYSDNGTKWYDLSGNGNNANAVNGPIYNSNGYWTLDGADDYFWLENLNYGDNSQITEATILAWVNTTYSNGNNSGWDNDNWAILDFDRSEVFNFAVSGSGFIAWADFNAVTDVIGNTQINDGNWHLIGITYSYNNDYLKMWLNGKLDKEFNGLGSPLGNGGTNRYGFIGDGSEAGSEDGDRNNFHYKGSIGGLLFYDNQALSEESIQTIYEKTVAYYKQI